MEASERVGLAAESRLKGRAWPQRLPCLQGASLDGEGFSFGRLGCKGHLGTPFEIAVRCGGGRERERRWRHVASCVLQRFEGPPLLVWCESASFNLVGSRRESPQGLSGASFGSQLSGCESGSVKGRVGAAGDTGDRASGRRAAGSFFGRDRLSERRAALRGATLQQEGRTGQRSWKKGDRREAVQLGPDGTPSGVSRDRSLPTSSGPGRWRQSSGWLPQARSGFTRRGG